MEKWCPFVISKLEAIKNNGYYTCSVEKLFVREWQTSSGVSQYLCTLVVNKAVIAQRPLE